MERANISLGQAAQKAGGAGRGNFLKIRVKKFRIDKRLNPANGVSHNFETLG
jgi:hypothetical protein